MAKLMSTGHHARLAKRLNYADHQASGYRSMLEVAKRFGMEYELERIPACIREWDEEYTDAIEAAVDAGYGPEDFEDDSESIAAVKDGF